MISFCRQCMSPSRLPYAIIGRHGGKPMTLRVTRREFTAAVGSAAAWPVVGRARDLFSESDLLASLNLAVRSTARSARS